MSATSANALAAARAGLKILVIAEDDNTDEAKQWRVNTEGVVKIAHSATEFDMLLADDSTSILLAVCPRALDDPSRRNLAEKLGFVTCDPYFGVSPRYLAYWLTRASFEDAIVLYFKNKPQVLATLQDTLILSCKGRDEVEGSSLLLHCTTDYLGPDFSPKTSALQARIHEDKRTITNETLVLEELCIQAVYCDARGAGALVSLPVARYHQYKTVQSVSPHLTLAVTSGYQAWQQGPAAFELLQLLDYRQQGCIQNDEVILIGGFTAVVFSKPIRLASFFAPSFTVLTPSIATKLPVAKKSPTSTFIPSSVIARLSRAFALPALAAVIHLLSQRIHASFAS